jgi:hypothetical protein
MPPDRLARPQQARHRPRCAGRRRQDTLGPPQLVHRRHGSRHPRHHRPPRPAPPRHRPDQHGRHHRPAIRPRLPSRPGLPGTYRLLPRGSCRVRGSGSGGPWSGPLRASLLGAPSTGSGTRMPRCSATRAWPTTRSSGGSVTPILARSAGTATPTPTRETARPLATRSTPPSRPRRPTLGMQQQRVDFVDGKVDQPLAGHGPHRHCRRSNEQTGAPPGT